MQYTQTHLSETYVSKSWQTNKDTHVPRHSFEEMFARDPTYTTLGLASIGTVCRTQPQLQDTGKVWGNRLVLRFVHPTEHTSGKCKRSPRVCGMVGQDQRSSDVYGSHADSARPPTTYAKFCSCPSQRSHSRQGKTTSQRLDHLRARTLVHDTDAVYPRVHQWLCWKRELVFWVVILAQSACAHTPHFLHPHTSLSLPVGHNMGAHHSFIKHENGSMTHLVSPSAGSVFFCCQSMTCAVFTSCQGGIMDYGDGRLDGPHLSGVRLGSQRLLIALSLEPCTDDPLVRLT